MPDEVINKFKIYIKEHVGSYKIFPQGRTIITESEYISSLSSWEEILNEELTARQEQKIFNWMKINDYFKPE